MHCGEMILHRARIQGQNIACLSYLRPGSFNECTEVFNDFKG